MVMLSFLTESSTLKKVDDAIEARELLAPPRDYLGMSEIGDICERRLWLKLHGGLKENFSARMLSLFGLGHMIEDRIKADLGLAGFQVGFEQLELSDFDGKFRGHCDGVIMGLVESKKPHILECKSASSKNFELFKKEGVEKHGVYGAKYSAQLQAYMGYAGIDRALIIVENKETSERYAERVKYDAGVFKSIKEKAGRIIESAAPPAGISLRTDWWQCKTCPANNENMCRTRWPGEAAF